MIEVGVPIDFLCPRDVPGFIEEHVFVALDEPDAVVV
jgi:hypothetical protein